MEGANGRGKTHPEASSRTPRTRSSAGQRESSELRQRQRCCHSIAAKLGCSPSTLRSWCIQAERDVGVRPGLRSADKARIKELERKNRELRTANEILKKASASSITRTREGGIQPPVWLMWRETRPPTLCRE